MEIINIVIKLDRGKEYHTAGADLRGQRSESRTETRRGPVLLIDQSTVQYIINALNYGASFSLPFSFHK